MCQFLGHPVFSRYVSVSFRKLLSNNNCNYRYPNSSVSIVNKKKFGPSDLNSAQQFQLVCYFVLMWQNVFRVLYKLRNVHYASLLSSLNPDTTLGNKRHAVSDD